MGGRGEHAEAFSTNGLDAYCLDISSDAAFVYQDKKDKLVVCDSGKDTYPFDDDTFEDGITFIRDDFFADMAYDDFSELNDISRDAMSRREGYIDFDAWK